MVYNIAEIKYTSCYPVICNLVPERQTLCTQARAIKSKFLKISKKPHILAYLGGLAGCVYSSKLIERLSSSLENYLARLSSSFCEIWNTSSCSRFELESDKKGSSMSRPTLDPCLDSSIPRSSNSFALYTVYSKGGLRQINTCHKVPLQVNFLDDDILLWCLYS